jgi:hypothetical protein
MNYHYLDPNNQPGGPVSVEEIHALVRQGKLAADPLVAPVGGTEWTPLSVVTGATVAAAAVPARAPAAAPAPASAERARLPFRATLLGDLLGVVVKVVARVLSPALVGSTLKAARNVGQFAVLAGTVVAAGYSIVAAARSSSLATLLFGVGFVIALAVGQYVASKFLDAGEVLIANTPSRFSSPAFLECAGLLAVLFGLVTLVLGVVAVFRGAPPYFWMQSIILTIAALSLGAIALHPELVGIEAGKGTAGEEAIGLLAFGLKAALKLVPLGFCVCTVVGLLASFAFIFWRDSALAYGFGQTLAQLPMDPIGSPELYGALAIFQACLLPFVAYVLFLLACLPLEIWRAVLSLPGKLDALKR